ncbi:hypothetical protein AB0G60_26935 [Streptomyces angustmyceticus]|uniref:Histone protein n=1 Tax=Streptomyces angustmyceticus TaxID=285578 RepID=A0A5J4LTG3_9ACTN|nr:hypothetical protein [Streptomyces angustmyceticus]UAL66026.1 hypothetical protein K7396_05275 [Streptomyces angustmyceticus]GES33685.1 hypothetical protein San01_61730 [Streptomyces angustmyceticus]
METDTKVTLAAALAAGYVLGRTKKGKLAIGVASMVAGQALSPRELIGQALRSLAATPQAAQLMDQVRGELLESGRTALSATADRSLGALAGALQKRTSALQGPPEDEEPAEGEEPAEDEEEGEAEDEEGPADDEEESADESEEAEGEEEKPSGRRPEKSSASRARTTKSPGKKAPAKKAASGKPAAKKKSAKKTAAKKTSRRTSRRR